MTSRVMVEFLDDLRRSNSTSGVVSTEGPSRETGGEVKRTGLECEQRFDQGRSGFDPKRTRTKRKEPVPRTIRVN